MAFNNFGKQIKKRLIDLGQTQEWLARQVTEGTGLYCDRSYLYKIMSGRRRAPKIVAAICEILKLEQEETTNE